MDPQNEVVDVVFHVCVGEHAFEFERTATTTRALVANILQSYFAMIEKAGRGFVRIEMRSVFRKCWEEAISSSFCDSQWHTV